MKHYPKQKVYFYNNNNKKLRIKSATILFIQFIYLFLSLIIFFVVCFKFCYVQKLIV